ncbi:MAG: B12-binding domain-containing radical SAM protein [SAR202 cluster bacterium]|nr:B12-binding domain-containing radical SAM protein [SAR202 cluster bacterium]
MTLMTATKAKRILLTVMPYEGEVTDRVTSKFYKNSAVKYMPLGVLSIAACIQEEHEVSVLDAASRGLDLEQTIEEIEKFQPDILGLSVVTYRAWSMIQILNRTTAPIKVVGGPHATYNHEVILNQGAHAVFVGDAEITFPKWLNDGCPPGIFKSAPVPLGDLPFPARHLMDLKDYEIESNDDMLFNVGRLRLPMYSSKGCPLKCIYCDVQQKTFNFKSPERCVEEFQELIGMGATSIHILDDAFNIQKERITTMAKLIMANEIDVDWSARGTVETREEVVADLGASGCKRLHVGIEHLDDNVLEYFKKAQRFEHIQQFCNLANQYGITILGYLIIGAPMETEEYRKNLPQMVEDIGIRLPYFNLLTPLAETPYYFQLLKDGTLTKDYWKEFVANPVRDWEMPSARSLEEDKELQAVIDDYVVHFRRKEMPIFVS